VCLSTFSDRRERGTVRFKLTVSCDALLAARRETCGYLPGQMLKFHDFELLWISCGLVLHRVGQRSEVDIFDKICLWMCLFVNAITFVER